MKKQIKFLIPLALTMLLAGCASPESSSVTSSSSEESSSSSSSVSITLFKLLELDLSLWSFSVREEFLGLKKFLILNFKLLDAIEREAEQPDNDLVDPRVLLSLDSPDTAEDINASVGVFERPVQ